MDGVTPCSSRVVSLPLYPCCLGLNDADAGNGLSSDRLEHGANDDPSSWQGAGPTNRHRPHRRIFRLFDQLVTVCSSITSTHFLVLTATTLWCVAVPQ